MRYNILTFWNKFGKNCRAFLTSRIKGSLYLLAKNLLIPRPTRKNIQYAQYMQNVVFSFEKRLQLSETLLVRFPLLNKKMPSATFHTDSIGEMLLPLNAISKALNCPFSTKEDFFRKLANTSITFFICCFPSY